MTTTIKLDRWHTPATDYPRERVGRAEIKTRRYSRGGVYENYMQRGYRYYVAERRLTITTLAIDGKTWMVDDPPHWWAMEEHARAYTGHVLCAGLGLGLMVHTLTACDSVERITVIEREPDVIDLVAPHVPHDKLDIICNDFWKIDAADYPANGVLFDLFVGNAHELMGQAIRVAMDILDRWQRDDDDFTVRVHGFPNPYIAEVALGVRQARGLVV